MRTTDVLARMALPVTLATALLCSGCGAEVQKDSVSTATPQETVAEEATEAEADLEEASKATFDGTMPYVTDYAYEVDLRSSTLYDEATREAAVETVMSEFNRWEGCTMLRIAYTDDATSAEALPYVRELRPDAAQPFAEAMVLTCDFHSPAPELCEGTAWESDQDYLDYQFYLARTADGPWQVVTCGYC